MTLVQPETERRTPADLLRDLLADLRCIEQIYERDRVAHLHAREIERIFDRWLYEDQADLEAALRQAEPPTRETPGWRDIDTAPKTRDGLLLTDGRVVSQGGWLSQLDQGAEYEGQCGAPSAGWWSVDCIDPTHWQPLPAPPAVAEES